MPLTLLFGMVPPNRYMAPEPEVVEMEMAPPALMVAVPDMTTELLPSMVGYVVPVDDTVPPLTSICEPNIPLLSAVICQPLIYTASLAYTPWAEGAEIVAPAPMVT